MKIFSRAKDVLRKSWIMSGSWYSFFKLIFLWVWLHPTIWPLAREVSTFVELRAGNRTGSLLVRNNTDLMSIAHTFVDGEYKLEQPKSAEVILDLGGYIGESALYFSLIYPEANIYVYEPDPYNFSALETSFRNHPKIICVNEAVSDQPGQLDFYSRDNGVGSTMVDRDGDMPTHQVATTTVDSIRNKYDLSHIDILKFDIEGYEYKVLSAVSDKRSVSVFAGEIHYDLMPEREVDIRSLFTDFDLAFRPHGGDRYSLYAVNSNLIHES